MFVPLAVRPVGHVGSCGALLLDTPAVADLVALLDRLPALPRIYRVADGFLLVGANLGQLHAPRTVRLTALAEHLWMPVGGQLTPALLPTEATACTAAHGLVLLPAGRHLAYDRTPVSLAHLLQVPVARSAWQRLPTAFPWADRLRSIERAETPSEAVETILQAGRPDGAGAGEMPRAPESSAADEATARGQLSRAGWLDWLGKMLGWQALRDSAAGLVLAALQRMPRLAEELLGQQQAALRELLRRFQEGDIEAALRQALPLTGEGNADTAQGNTLPQRDARYSLGLLLRGDGRGPAAGWQTPDDMHLALTRAYREAAEDALRRGDARRAAYIYGHLLGDFRAAADALAAGGHHRDAAILYRDRLADPLRAAEQFVACGDYDQALRLFVMCEQHERAGDLYRELGQDAQATDAYRQAAEQCERQRAYVRATGLLAGKAQLPAEALAVCERAWQERGGLASWPEALTCQQRLLRHAADTGDGKTILALLDEADADLQPARFHEEARAHYQRLAETADELGVWADELRERARFGFARQLQHRVGSGERGKLLVPELLGGRHWTPALRADAERASRKVLSRTGQREWRPVQLHEGTVTAVTQAAATGEWFVGFADGTVVSYEPRGGKVREIVGVRSDWPQWQQLGLATDDNGMSVAVLRRNPNGHDGLTTWLRGGDDQFASACHHSSQSERIQIMLTRLHAPLQTGVRQACLVDELGHCQLWSVSSSQQSMWNPSRSLLDATGLLLERAGQAYVLLVNYEKVLLEPLVYASSASLPPLSCPWPGLPPASQTPLVRGRLVHAWPAHDRLDIAHLTDKGRVEWVQIDPRDGTHRVQRSKTGDFQALHLRPDGTLLVVNRAGGLERWTWPTGGTLQMQAMQMLERRERIVALTHAVTVREALALTEGGLLLRIADR